MRKVLIIALGLASLGALAGVQPAAAGKKRICQTDFTYTRQFNRQCKEGHWDQNNCQTQITRFGNIAQCFDVEVQTPTAPSKGNSSSAVKTYTPSTNLKNR